MNRTAHTHCTNVTFKLTCVSNTLPSKQYTGKTTIDPSILPVVRKETTTSIHLFLNHGCVRTRIQTNQINPFWKQTLVGQGKVYCLYVLLLHTFHPRCLHWLNAHWVSFTFSHAHKNKRHFASFLELDVAGEHTTNELRTKFREDRKGEWKFDFLKRLIIYNNNKKMVYAIDILEILLLL